MSMAIHPPHLDQFLSNIKEVERLQEIHSKVTPPGRGRKYDVEVIHKSCIVLLIACWEAFVEDLATSALEFMLLNAKDHTAFPKDVLARIASSNQGEKAWDLAGSGWKSVMQSSFKAVLAKTTGALNTPKTGQTNELFQKVLGIPKLSSSWSWANSNASANEKFLDYLVSLRGSIAHRVEASDAVGKREVDGAIRFIARIAMKSHNQVNHYVNSKIGMHPWLAITYRGKS